MSIMRCESCERFVDTDFEEMHDIGNQRRLERWVCERCAEEWHDEQEAEQNAADAAMERQALRVIPDSF
ncbi:MAG: hypothetical protein KGS44_13195 [Alphaproteobacteria bacterium]|nr:hypothetical protein [Alphaproteobacteria bacterium]